MAKRRSLKENEQQFLVKGEIITSKQTWKVGEKITLSNEKVIKYLKSINKI